MRISDWSSDVCSSDLMRRTQRRHRNVIERTGAMRRDLAVGMPLIVDHLHLDAGLVDVPRPGGVARKVEDAAVAAALDLPVERQIERAVTVGGDEEIGRAHV